MNAAYDINMPIKIFFDQIKDCMDYATVGNNPKNLTYNYDRTSDTYRDRNVRQ